MRIILSPAKKMRSDRDSLPCHGLPKFLNQAEELKEFLQSLSYDALKELWNCNDKITAQNIERFNHINLHSGLTPAILSYDGIAYQHMAPSVFTDEELSYVQEHLRILSAFYGVLCPFDGVTPYRLEMQAKVHIGNYKNLYDFWGDQLYQSVLDQDRVLINLASKEYSKCIMPYLQPQDCMITCTFMEKVSEKMVQKATFAKMARGEMVRFMAENNIINPDNIKHFDRLGYRFREDLSSDAEFVFERET